MPPRQEPVSPGGPEPVWGGRGKRKPSRERSALWGPGQCRDPNRQLLPLLQQGQTPRWKGGCCPQSRQVQNAHSPKANEAPAAATWSRSPAPGPPRRQALFPDGGCSQPRPYRPASRFVYQHLFQFPAPPSSPLPLLCPFTLSLSCSPPAPQPFLYLTPSLCLPFPHPSLRLLSPGPACGMGAFGGSLGMTETHRPSPLCPVTAAGRVGKEQRREAQPPKELGRSSGRKRN